MFKRISEWFDKWWDKHFGPGAAPPYVKNSAIERRHAAELVERGVCPDCQSTAGFLAGPSGGLCQNIECSACHSKFNVGIAGDSIFHFERI